MFYYYLPLIIWIQVERKKINLALYFIEFLSVNRVHSEKQYVTKASLRFLETALSQVKRH